MKSMFFDEMGKNFKEKKVFNIYREVLERKLKENLN